jgi:MscS family membrane protein
MDLNSVNINYVYAAAVIVFGFLFALLTRTIVRWLEAKAGETDTKWDDIIIAAIGTPAQVAIVFIAVHFAITRFDVLPANLQWLLDPNYSTTFYILIGAWILSSFLHDILRTYGRELAEQSDSDMDDRLVELLELVVRYIIWFGAVMAILSVFQVNITPFLAGAGIAGLAVALAAQDLISNFFGGAIITVDKPFKVGDRVKIDQYLGDVVSVGTRSTRIRTLDYQIVTIPNNKITTNIIVNLAEPDQKLRLTLPVSVAYGNDPSKIKIILIEIARDAIKNSGYLLAEPAPSVFFTEFGPSSLNFILKIWAEKYHYNDEVKDAINCRIAERFSKEGIEIPFPQMEVRIKK